MEYKKPRLRLILGDGQDDELQKAFDEIADILGDFNRKVPDDMLARIMSLSPRRPVGHLRLVK